MDDSQDVDFFPLNPENYPVVSHSQLLVSFEGSLERFAVFLGMGGQAFFNGLFYNGLGLLIYFGKVGPFDFRVV